MAEALAAGVHFLDLFVDQGAADVAERVTSAEDGGLPVTLVSEPVMRALSDTVTDQGIVGVAEIPEVTLADIPRLDLIVVLAAVRDPGNAGTLVRSAVAAGADAVLFTGDSVDPFSPKCVRASAGAMFHVPLVSADTEDAADHLRSRGVKLLGADAGASKDAYSEDLTEPVALVIGNEGWGLPEEFRRFLDGTINIPMPGPVDSLNAAIAGSVLLFEAVRQREGGLLESSSDG